MATEMLNPILILQDRDMKLQQIEQQLGSLPAESQAIQARISALEVGLVADRQSLKELEARGRLIDSEMEQVESQVVKYKNQQLIVKKNEEYQALTHEIERSQAKVAELEEAELEILYEIEASQKQLVEAEIRVKEEIARERTALVRLEEKEQNLNGEVDAARSEKVEAEAQVEKQSLSIYRRVGMGLRFPVVVPLTSGKCGGCHMKASSAVQSDVQVGSKITTCDNCSRILYWVS